MTIRRGFFKVIAGVLAGVVTLIGAMPTDLLAGEPELLMHDGAVEEFKCDNWNLRIVTVDNPKPMLKGTCIPHDKFYPKTDFVFHVDSALYKTNGDYKMKCLEGVNEMLEHAYQKYKEEYFSDHS